MVRLVFRPYTRVGRSICTSEPRRSSTRVSSGFDLPGHSSPSFGSRHMRSVSLPPSRRCREGPTVRLPPYEEERSRLGIDEPSLRLHCALGFFDPSDSRMCQTPRSVFQDGSVGTTFGYNRDSQAILESGLRFRAASLRPARRRPAETYTGPRKVDRCGSSSGAGWDFPPFYRERRGPSTGTRNSNTRSA